MYVWYVWYIGAGQDGEELRARSFNACILLVDGQRDKQTNGLLLLTTKILSDGLRNRHGEKEE